MVMDENSRNGWKWHLAQQLAQHVIIQKQQLTYHVINPHIMQLSMTQSHGFIYNQIPIIIIYNLLTNKWLKYGIINLWT